jgi:cytoskeletal protein CcmA (bactofilin family)
MSVLRASASDSIREFERMRRTLRPITANAGPAGGTDPAAPDSRHESNITVRTVPAFDILGQKDHDPAPGAAPPLVDAATSPRAVLRVVGDLSLDAAVACDVEVSGRVRVGPSARVDGVVRANDLDVHGQVVGAIVCPGLVEVAPSGHVQGDLEVGRLVVHEGGKIDGQVHMLVGPDQIGPIPSIYTASGRPGTSDDPVSPA